MLCDLYLFKIRHKKMRTRSKAFIKNKNGKLCFQTKRHIFLQIFLFLKKEVAF